jgi:IS5 family transposase
LRSERQLIERLDTDLLFRWFCGMDPASPVFDATAFAHNRPRLDAHGITAAFFDAVVQRAVAAGLTSDDHFSVDGTLIESYASIKSFKSIEKTQGHDDPDDPNGFKPRNAEVDFHRQKRSNATHRSTTDPEARLYRKGDGQSARLCHMGHALCENRNGLILQVTVTQACGMAEQEAALSMLDDLYRRQRIRPKTLGADKGYDSGPWMIALEQRGITPHAAMRGGTIGGDKGTSHLLKKNRPHIAARKRMAARMDDMAYTLSQRYRKKIEEGFGWCKTIAGLHRTRLVGRWKIIQQFNLAAAAYNLVRMRKLLHT